MKALLSLLILLSTNICCGQIGIAQPNRGVNTQDFFVLGKEIKIHIYEIPAKAKVTMTHGTISRVNKKEFTIAPYVQEGTDTLYIRVNDTVIFTKKFDVLEKEKVERYVAKAAWGNIKKDTATIDELLANLEAKIIPDHGLYTLENIQIYILPERGDITIYESKNMHFSPQMVAAIKQCKPTDKIGLHINAKYRHNNKNTDFEVFKTVVAKQ